MDHVTLHQEWTDLIGNQTKETFDAFWQEYSDAEIKIYGDLLDKPTTKVSGSLQELAETYQVRPVIFMGFLDGVQDSLKNKQDCAAFDLTSSVALEVDFEKLYYNMLVAEAKHLYTLPQWDAVLSEETRTALLKQYRRSKTVVKGDKVGRNDPCPCGSGKKYKKCCGA